MLELAADYASITFAGIAAVAAVIAVFTYVRKCQTTPRFVVGVIPDSHEMRRRNIRPQDLGIPLGGDLSAEVWHFNRKYFVREEWCRRSLTSIKDILNRTSKQKRKIRGEPDEKSLREISVSNDGYAQLFVLLANEGKRVAEHYTLMIGFDNRWHSNRDIHLYDRRR